MDAVKKNWWKVLVAVIIGVSLDGVAHQVIPSTTSLMTLPLSRVTQLLGMVPTIFIYFLITFGSMAMIFVLIQDSLQGSKWTKGLRYGISMSLLWFFGIIETSPILGAPLGNEAVTSLADVVPIFFMCLLLAKLTTLDTTQAQRRESIRKSLMAAATIAATYTLGRYFAYVVLHIESGLVPRPLATLIWTIGMGVSIGVIYLLLEHNTADSTLTRRLIRFGVVFGINWLLFTLFVPLVFDESNLLVFTVRAGLDVAFVFLGLLVSAKWNIVE